MHYSSANEAKATFDDIYTAPTPAAYFARMGELDYQIGEQARPFFLAAIDLLQEQLGDNHPTRVLDLGCSYGVGAALHNHDVTFRELATFFAARAPEDYQECVQATQEFITRHRVENAAGFVGADASAAAIQFAVEAGLMEAGIARDLETTPQLPAREAALVRECNLLTSTGAIGYVGQPTVSTLLEHLGGAAEVGNGPYAVVTILRMFDSDPVARTFNEFGYVFARVPGAHLLQRRFESEVEQRNTIELLDQRGIDPSGLETEGNRYAEVFAAAPTAGIGRLMQCLCAVADRAA